MYFVYFVVVFGPLREGKEVYRIHQEMQQKMARDEEVPYHWR